MPIARLDDRAVLQIAGAEARAFLQGLITNDMEKVAPRRAIYAALLTPQGKVLFDFFVTQRGETYLLDASATQAEDLLKRLKIYRLRAKVDLAARPDLAVFAIWDKTGGLEQPEEWSAFPDPRLAAMGRRVIAARDDTFLTANAEADAAGYALHRLALGVPDSADVAGEFLLDANGEELNGVDFKKGCYVGQEVTARMKHKAQPRRRLVPISMDGEVPPPGTKLRDTQGAEVGELATGAGGRAMASVRLDRLGGAGSLDADGHVLSVESAGYPLPAAKPAAG